MRGFAFAPLEFRTVSRLIVISNRVSAPKARTADGTQGGLAVALAAALREARGIWFGWSGNKTDEFTGQINLHRDEGVTARRSTSRNRTSTNITTAMPIEPYGHCSIIASTSPNMTAASVPATSGSTTASPRPSRR